MSKRQEYIEQCRSIIREAIASCPDFGDEFEVERAIVDARRRFIPDNSGTDFDAFQAVVREEMNRREIARQRAQSRSKPLAGQLPLFGGDFDNDGGEQ